MYKSILLSITLILSFTVFSQERAYIIYNSKGKKVSFKKMIKSLSKKDIVLFGEYHDNPISHWLEYEITKELNKKRKLILGAEMIEADNQSLLNKYVSDSISYQTLDSLARLWQNHKTDYAPLVEFAKAKKLNFIATNIPRRYANMVYKKGFGILDSLSPKEKQWIAPLPIPFDSELKTYQDILAMMGDHGSPKLVMAQASKDATMAHFILDNYKQDHLFIHYNGSYHSDYKEGILWYLNKRRSDLNYSNISTVTQKDINRLDKENHKRADFIICIDNEMTTTY